MLLVRNESLLFVCGTNAFNPVCANYSVSPPGRGPRLGGGLGVKEGGNTNGKGFWGEGRRGTHGKSLQHQHLQPRLCQLQPEPPQDGDPRVPPTPGCVLTSPSHPL